MRLRALFLACATVAGVAALLGLAHDAALDLLSRAGTAGWEHVPLDVAITALAAVALAACGAWLLLVAAATAVEALAGASWGVLRAVSPHVVRRLVLVGCGLAVGSAGVMPVAAALHDEEHAGQGAVGQPSARAVAGLPLPDRPWGILDDPAGQGRARLRASREPGPPSTRPAREALAAPAARAGTEMLPVAAVAPRPGTYMVSPGDSLWAIARRFLPGADLATTDAAWRRIHRANRELVGPDPDLIFPGTALRIPQPLVRAGHLDAPGQPDISPPDTSPPRRKDAS